MRKKNIPEFKKRNDDSIDSETECKRVIANYVEHKITGGNVMLKRIKLGSK